MNKFKFISILILLLSFTLSKSYSYSSLVAVKNKFGMYQASFELERGGVVKVNLPADMALSETVSGSMIYNGNINQFELLIEGKIMPISGNNFTFRLPDNVSTGIINVILRFSNGIEIGKAFFPVNIFKLKNTEDELKKTDFNLPVYGSSGIPIDVEGVFDGNYSTTFVSFSGKRLKVLAESTTRAVFVTTNDHKGQGILSLKELGKSKESQFTNLVVVKIEEKILQSPPVPDIIENEFEKNSDFKELTADKPYQEGKKKEPSESELLADYKEKIFEEKAYKELPNSNNLPPEELHHEVEEKFYAVPKEVVPQIRIETPLKNINVEEKKETAVKSAADQINTLDYSIVSDELEKQFSSKFYSNNPDLIKRKEVVQNSESLNEVANSNQISENNEELLSAPPFQTKKTLNNKDIYKDLPDDKQTAAKSSELDEKLDKQFNSKIIDKEEINIGEAEKKIDTTQNSYTTLKEVADREKSANGNNPKAKTKELSTKDIKINKADNDLAESAQDKSEKSDQNKISVAKNISVSKDKQAEKNLSEKNADDEKIVVFPDTQKNTATSSNSKNQDKAVDNKTATAKIKENIPEDNDVQVMSEKSYCIQLASFKLQSEVDNFLSILKSNGYIGNVKQVDLSKKGSWLRVRICDFETRISAENFSKTIDKNKLNISSLIVTDY